jgi:hypothetical protein
VVTSPWKLGLFVFLLVAGCGFGLIYAYYGYFGGSLDFSDRDALYTFYGICGGVALLGLIGYLTVVGAAQPVDRVVHGGRRRQRLMKKAGQIEDPTRIDLEDFQDEPALAALLERWREDRSAADEARHAASGEAPAASEDEELGRRVAALRQHEQSLREVCDRMSAGLQRAMTSGNGLDATARRIVELAEQAGGLALNANLHLSRLGDEGAPLLDDMDQLREICTRFQTAAGEIETAAGRSGGVGLGLADGVADLDEGLCGLDAVVTALETALGVGAPEAGVEDRDLDGTAADEPMAEEEPVAVDESPAPASADPSASGPVSDAFSHFLDTAQEAEPASPEPDQKLAQVHDELFTPAPARRGSGPVDTRQEEKVHDLSDFGAVVLDEAPPARASDGERVYDLSDFGAVELG